MSEDQERGRRHTEQKIQKISRPREDQHEEGPRTKHIKHEADEYPSTSRGREASRGSGDAGSDRLHDHPRTKHVKHEADEYPSTSRDREARRGSGDAGSVRLEDQSRTKHIKHEADDNPSTSRGREASRGNGDAGSDRSQHHPVRDRSQSSIASNRGNGGVPGDRSRRGGRSDRSANYDLVCTRPKDIINKKGKSGQAVKLQANYFKLLTTPTWSIYHYHVEFEPPVDKPRLRSGLLSEYRSLFGGFICDGASLFCCNFVEDREPLELVSHADEKFRVKLKLVGVIAMTEEQSLQVLNLILRRAMSGLKLQLVGRNFYDPHAKIDLREFHMQLWPGYNTSIRQHESGLMLCSEIAHKVMRSETAYHILRDATQSSRDYKETFRRKILGTTVLTDYNNETYTITDVDFTITPQHTFTRKNEVTSFVKYYQKKYGIHIRDPDQPMLVTKAKSKKIRGAPSDIVLLVPELCRTTGLTDEMRANFQLMRAMSDHTRMNPDHRLTRLREFNQRLQSTPNSVEALAEWKMTLDRHLVEFDGRIVDQQKIIFKDKTVLAGEQADWTREFRTNELFQTPSRGLRSWAVIATNRQSRDLRNFCEALMRSASGMGLKMNAPKEILLYDDRNHSFMQAMDECAREDPQLILCLVPNNNAERYGSIKRKGCLERGIPTQVITQKTASNQRGLMSVATKVAIQINCKLGYTPWIVNIPCKGLMTIGYDSAKSTRDKSKAFGALVATMDMQCNATFYSTVAECNSHDVLANHLWPMMAKALRQYLKEHQSLPARILFYRDGVGEGSLQQVYEHEVSDIVNKLGEEYSRFGMGKPLLSYVLVSKKINTRLFLRGRNPPPGTVVDDTITLPERFDFFLVSQSVRQGTVSPTSYNVVYSTINLTPDQIQLLTYKHTHLYYNWSGTTRVPAVCQYAKKLATLVATCLYQPPVNAMEKKLFYL